jgi:protein-tyrosine phosphatase
VIAHCRMGIGRSSTFAAATLVKLGVPADGAWEKIAVARGRPVPDVAAQRSWIVDMTALLTK